MSDVKIYIAVPLMDEFDYIDNLISSLKKQSYKNFTACFCVNQHDDYWGNPDKISICENNQKTIKYLSELEGLDINIIDRSSKGKGWQGKEYGVGWARKIVMDSISRVANDNDIIICCDGDTSFGEGYFQSVVENFNKHPKGIAMSNPYYHNLTEDDDLNRHILRYEIYLRHYAINLWKIKSPYSITPLGSAISVKNSVYKKVGGISPKYSGEDFYFLQKLRKYNKVINHNTQKVYPLARYSDRVFFGTGPALIKGREGLWDSYPIYRNMFFKDIEETYSLFDGLYDEDIETPMSEFLRNQFKTEDIWSPLRKNFKTKEKFIEACHQKVDGFRVFQYLKYCHLNNIDFYDEDNEMKIFLKENSNHFNFLDIESFSFNSLPVEELDLVRNKLCNIETAYQKEHVFDSFKIN